MCKASGSPGASNCFKTCQAEVAEGDFDGHRRRRNPLFWKQYCGMIK